MDLGTATLEREIARGRYGGPGGESGGGTRRDGGKVFSLRGGDLKTVRNQVENLRWSVFIGLCTSHKNSKTSAYKTATVLGQHF